MKKDDEFVWREYDPIYGEDKEYTERIDGLVALGSEEIERLLEEARRKKREIIAQEEEEMKKKWKKKNHINT